MTEPKPRLWTQDDVATAAEIWQTHYADIHGEDYEGPKFSKARYPVLHRIAATIKRSYTSIEHRLEACGPSFGAMQRSPKQASAQQTADLLARKEAEHQRSLTAQFFGDPPPGYSALDRKRSGVAR